MIDTIKVAYPIQFLKKINPLSKLDEDDIEIAQLVHNLTNTQREEIKTIIHEWRRNNLKLFK